MAPVEYDAISLNLRNRSQHAVTEIVGQVGGCTYCRSEAGVCKVVRIDLKITCYVSTPTRRTNRPVTSEYGEDPNGDIGLLWERV